MCVYMWPGVALFNGTLSRIRPDQPDEMIIVGPFVAFTANVSDKSAIVSDEWALLL